MIQSERAPGRIEQPPGLWIETHGHENSVQPLNLKILPQPDDTTCGATCLHAVYGYYGETLDLPRVIEEVVHLPGGGTLAVWLGNHALRRGFRARIHTCNLQLFDPTWFAEGVDLAGRLRLQAERKEDQKLREASLAHERFLSAGGEVRFGHLTPKAIYDYHERGIPLVTGLSATYLYTAAREKSDQSNDVEGHPVGHFVVLAGSNPGHDRVLIADPLGNRPGHESLYYWVEADRLIASILLGVLTYDATVLVIQPSG